MSKQVTDQSFQAVLDEGLPVVVDFSATWCGPCKKISPIIDELAQEYEGRVNICKCDVDDNDELTSRFGIRTVPSILFFKGGELVDKLVGAAPKQTFAEKIESLL
jgi:thioredoxin 1